MNVYVVGDVVVMDGLFFIFVVSVDFYVVVFNLLKGNSKKIEYFVILFVVFIVFKMVLVGMSEEEVKNFGWNIKVK